MIIAPQTVVTNINERFVIRAALEAYIKDQNHRAQMLSTPAKIEQAEMDSARAQDLLVKFGEQR